MLKTILLVCTCFPLLAFADLGPCEHRGHSLEAKGKKILYHLWRDLKDANVKSISKYISPQFQAVHSSGVLNVKQELEFIKNLHFASFALNQIKITETKGTMVISYIATVNELVNNQPVSATAPRLSIFKKADRKWKWLSHANETR